MLPAAVRSAANRLLWFRRWVPPLDRAIALRKEMGFWRNWLDTRGGVHYGEDYDERFDLDLPLQPQVTALVDRLESDPVQILDVGAGPLTKLGKKHPSREIVITATDLLADHYNRLLDDRGITPPIRTIALDAQELLGRFGPNAFDITHGQNCIDHTADPVRAIEQMFAVTRPNGFVVLFHSENEGLKEGYQELHKWDFTCDGADFVIRNEKGDQTNVTQRFDGVAAVECTRVADDGRTAIRVTIHKPRA